MLDVCFGSGIKGSLSCAQHCGGSHQGATLIAVSGTHKFLHWRKYRKILAEARRAQQTLDAQAIPLGGMREDLCGISFDFSLGNISAPLTIADCPKKQLMCAQYAADDPEKFAQSQAYALHIWECCMEDLEKLKTRSALGEPVRIWVDKTPSAACGLLFVADLLKASSCEITVILLPAQEERPDGTVVKYRGWGDVAPELFASFLNRGIVLSQNAIASLSRQWQQLQAENALLRVVKDSTVVSAAADYYDHFIRLEYPENTCSIAQIILNVLTKYDLGIGDWLIARRIRVLLANGELQIVKEDPTRFYKTLVARAK